MGIMHYIWGSYDSDMLMREIVKEKWRRCSSESCPHMHFETGMLEVLRVLNGIQKDINQS